MSGEWLEEGDWEGTGGMDRKDGVRERKGGRAWASWGLENSTMPQPLDRPSPPVEGAHVAMGGERVGNDQLPKRGP